MLQEYGSREALDEVLGDAGRPLLGEPAKEGCRDLSTFVQEEPVPGSGTGITRIDLAIIDGYWKTTSYDPNTSDWTREDCQYCEDF
jgi:hypothetical protein